MKKDLHILIVEDVSSDAVLMQRELKNTGLSLEFQIVDTKTDYIDALQSFSPDLVLSDYSLSQFDGMQALELLKAKDRTIPFIIVTGAINEETAVDVMKAGATDYVLKDRLSRLSSAVLAVMERRKALQDKIKIEEALVASEIRYRRLFEMAREGILLLDKSTFTVIEANPYLVNLLETQLKQIKNKHLYEIGIFPDKAAFESAFEKFEEKEYIHFDKLEIQTFSGCVITTEMSCNSYMVDNKMTIQCNIRDISERIQAEVERQKIQGQLFQSQKMEAIGRLAGGIAHDFNNLMTAIQVSADVAIMNSGEEDVNYNDLQEIRFAALRAAGLIRQLLLFSREHPMELTVMQPNLVIENLLKMLKRLIGEDIDIATDLEKNLWNVRADTVNMEQVIMNLALNARDAMPNGGSIEIRTRNIAIEEDFCKTFTQARPGNFVCLSFVDTGEGMTEEVLSRIFEPFFTTKVAEKGSGLGLSVVYGIIKQHEGWINVQSSPGSGSTFQVYLPAVNDDPDDQSEIQERIFELHGQGEHILLIEDEEKVREFTAKALSRCGYKVTSCQSFEDALNLFAQEKETIDLVFSDVVLSDRTGIELAEKLIHQKPNLKILLTSGYLDHKSQWPLILERGYKFLQKPYALADLLRMVKNIIQE